MELSLENQIKQIMADIFEVDIESITESVTPRALSQWKGKKHRLLIEALQKKFNIRFDEEEIESLVSYKVIVSTIRSYLI